MLKTPPLTHSYIFICPYLMPADNFFRKATFYTHPLLCLTPSPCPILHKVLAVLKLPLIFCIPFWPLSLLLLANPPEIKLVVPASNSQIALLILIDFIAHFCLRTVLTPLPPFCIKASWWFLWSTFHLPSILLQEMEEKVCCSRLFLNTTPALRGSPGWSP